MASLRVDMKIFVARFVDKAGHGSSSWFNFKDGMIFDVFRLPLTDMVDILSQELQQRGPLYNGDV